MKKVIGVGWYKTGTSTLEKCLKILGYGPVAGFNGKLIQQVYEGGIVEVLKEADKYVSYQDAPWFFIYKELDKRYPGSKFILTVRKDHRKLIHSFIKQDLRYGIQYNLGIKEIIWKLLTNRYYKVQLKRYTRHTEGVIDYFKDRPADLFVICWEEENGWGRLCSFLEKPLPNVPLPHVHRSPHIMRLILLRIKVFLRKTFPFLVNLKKFLGTKTL